MSQEIELERFDLKAAKEAEKDTDGPSASKWRRNRNDAYAERNQLAILLARIATHMGWAAWVGTHPPGVREENQHVLFIELPSGQVSFCIDPQEAAIAATRLHPAKPARPWDGHDWDVKWKRIADPFTVPKPFDPVAELDL